MGYLTEHAWKLFRKVFILMRQSIRRGAWIARTGIFACEGGKEGGRRNKEEDYWWFV